MTPTFVLNLKRTFGDALRIQSRRERLKMRLLALIVRRRHPFHENRVTVPLEQQPLQHPLAWRSLRTGWPQ